MGHGIIAGSSQGYQFYLTAFSLYPRAAIQNFIITLKSFPLWSIAIPERNTPGKWRIFWLFFAKAIQKSPFGEVPPALGDRSCSFRSCSVCAEIPKHNQDYLRAVWCSRSFVHGLLLALSATDSPVCGRDIREKMSAVKSSDCAARLGRSLNNIIPGWICNLALKSHNRISPSLTDPARRIFKEVIYVEKPRHLCFFQADNGG